jgi:hypothetical protein
LAVHRNEVGPAELLAPGLALVECEAGHCWVEALNKVIKGDDDDEYEANYMNEILIVYDRIFCIIFREHKSAHPIASPSHHGAQICGAHFGEAAVGRGAGGARGHALVDAGSLRLGPILLALGDVGKEEKETGTQENKASKNG